MVLKIKLNTIKKTKKAEIPNVIRSFDIKSIVSTVIIEAPPRNSSPKKAYSSKIDLISSTRIFSFFDISSLSLLISSFINSRLKSLSGEISSYNLYLSLIRVS